MKNLNLGLLILRISLGVLFLLHGIAKIEHGIGGIEGILENKGLPSFFAYGVFVGEIIAPIMLIIGFRTRIAAIFYIITMVFAVYLNHMGDIGIRTPSGAWGIEVQALFLLGALALFFTGSGKLAVSTKHKWD